MTYAIAAAGTGGHVFPGLAVGEALISRGVDRSSILYLGGSRLERTVYPDAGFPFLEVELRGLSRSFSASNLGIPLVVLRAAGRMTGEMRARQVKVVLGMGGYVTIPAALAARRAGARLAVAEQNAEAGLANAIAGRLAERCFGAFPSTKRLPRAEWIGNPIRPSLSTFDRTALRSEAIRRYELDPAIPVVGVFGGSLGAGAINRQIEKMAATWPGPPMQLLHLAGAQHAESLEAAALRSVVRWRVLGFEQEMEWFYAASDLVIARAGGAVAELAATGTPSILVPGVFGSGSHQRENAAEFERVGAAEVLDEAELGGLSAVVASILSDAVALRRMAEAARRLAKPMAAAQIAAILEEMHA